VRSLEVERGIEGCFPKMGASTLASGESFYPLGPLLESGVVVLILIRSGGCQLQPVPYPLQLLHKRKTVQLAYSRFSALSPSFIPEIQPTIGSPKQWGYRTKITPHFDAPPKAARAAKEAREQATEEEGMNGENDAEKEEVGWECRIGFERKGRPGVLDIEVSQSWVFGEPRYDLGEE
jgi:hypothetical protein